MLPNPKSTFLILPLLVLILIGCVAPLQVITPTPLEETPTLTPSTPTPTPSPTPRPRRTPTPPPLRHIDLAGHVADTQNLRLLREMGGSLFIATLHWSDVEQDDVTPASGSPYIWDTLTPFLEAAQQRNMGLILRVDSPPDWAWRGGDPPLDMEALADFMADVAHNYGSMIYAYVIWNEPNLPAEWGGRIPNPTWYAQMLQAVYPRIKEWDNDAIIVASGLATTGGGGCEGEPPPNTDPLSTGAINDLAFLRGIYQSGAKGYFDILGTHPYGFAYAHDTDPCTVNGQAFRRAEQQRAIMEEFGDGAKPMWAVEYGWIARPPSECETDPSWQGLVWQGVDEETQGRNLARAYRYAANNWPWLTLLGVFNFDFATVPTYEFCHAFRWWSLAYRPNPQDPSSPVILRHGFFTLQSIPK